jgi:hypothetical protein
VSKFLLGHERLADAAGEGDDGQQAGDDPQSEVHDVVLRVREWPATARSWPIAFVVSNVGCRKLGSPRMTVLLAMTM